MNQGEFRKPIKKRLGRLKTFIQQGLGRLGRPLFQKKKEGFRDGEDEETEKRTLLKEWSKRERIEIVSLPALK